MAIFIRGHYPLRSSNVTGNGGHYPLGVTLTLQVTGVITPWGHLNVTGNGDPPFDFNCAVRAGARNRLSSAAAAGLFGASKALAEEAPLETTRIRLWTAVDTPGSERGDRLRKMPLWPRGR